ncbi:ABC transporter ATP-binding protein [Eggerthella lenta]|uniref:ABC transporter ATP-binding protein n=1 Tax=Eggerthella lenta TaxID=84112 RepID=UPI000DF7280F|nr:ABC transporter ATP-binding protein [Eggerthella lenta]RDC08415.1 glycerol-3-phosphate ABC transporter ATP-binding protein [Eggerthella lenta]
MSHLEIRHLSKTYKKGAVNAVTDFSLNVEDGDFVVLVGSSGCGKSTVLRTVAGLETPTSGSILVNGNDITSLQPADRNIAMIFQNYALYPHMTVFDNIAFPLKVRKTPKEETRRRVTEICETLEIVEYMDRKPSSLSGGQQQRVAIGRALVRKPSLFLMDEPLSNLDAKLRTQMRDELAKLHHNTNATIVYVTHDQVEAMTLATKIVVMDKGVIQQIGTPLDLYFSPSNIFVAGFIGSPRMNFLECRSAGGYLRYAGGSIAIPSLDRSVRENEGADLALGVRPENVELESASAPRQGPETIQGSYVREEIIGSEVYAYIDVSGESFICKTEMQSLGLHKMGDRVRLRLKENSAFLFDHQSGETITPSDRP